MHVYYDISSQSRLGARYKRPGWVARSPHPPREQPSPELNGTLVSSVLWPLQQLPALCAWPESFKSQADMDLNTGSTTYRLCDLGQGTGPLQASNPTFIPPGIGVRVK